MKKKEKNINKNINKNIKNKLKINQNIKKILNLNLILLLIFLLNINFIFAQNQTDLPNNYKYLKLKIKNQINFNLDFQKNFKVDNFILQSKFFINSNNKTQFLNDFKSSQNYNIKQENNLENYYLEFNYDKNKLKQENNLENIFIIENIEDFPKIKQKTKFPINKQDKKYQKYLEFNQMIDFDENIEKQANKIAYKKDDVYTIAFDIANFLKNDIKYDLKTIFENPNQKATQTFKIKKGVCKEITNLYVAMLRKLNIPARVVSGYSYTDSKELIEFTNSNWGAHAWAEVLIGDIWVPFDLTYNQLGFVDSTHIYLKKSPTLDNNSIKITSSSYGINFKDKIKTKNNFEILSKKFLKQKKNIKIELLSKKELGFGSYGFLEIKITNLDDFYNTINLNLVEISNLENQKIITFLDNIKYNLLLKPNQEKKIYIKYKISKNLNPNNFYIIPFTIKTDFQKIETQIKIQKNSQILKLKDLPKNQKINQNQNFSFNKLKINCSLNLDYKNYINCIIYNKNNYNIENFTLCLNKNCTKINLNIEQKKQIKFYTKNIYEIINYKYKYFCSTKKNKTCQINNKIILNAKKPSLSYQKNIDFNKNLFKLKYQILNYSNMTYLEIHLNKNQIKFNKEKNNLSLKLLEKNNNITILLKHKNLTFYKKNYKIKIKKKNFLEKIIIFIKNKFEN